MTRPCEPPSDQRSCCQAATRFDGLTGLTASVGSTSAFAYCVPVAIAPSHPGVNGDAADTRTLVSEVSTGGGGGGGGPEEPPPQPWSAASARKQDTDDSALRITPGCTP